MQLTQFSREKLGALIEGGKIGAGISIPRKQLSLILTLPDRFFETLRQRGQSLTITPQEEQAILILQAARSSRADIYQIFCGLVEAMANEGGQDYLEKIMATEPGEEMVGRLMTEVPDVVGVIETLHKGYTSPDDLETAHVQLFLYWQGLGEARKEFTHPGNIIAAATR